MKVSKKVAKLAKEKGFNLPVFYFYEEGKLQPYEYNLPCKVDVVRIHQIKGENFNSKSHSLYSETISVPKQDDLRKWLREKHNIHIEVSYCFTNDKYMVIIHNKINQRIEIELDLLTKKPEEYLKYDSYESALEIGLEEGLKLINLS